MGEFLSFLRGVERQPLLLICLALLLGLALGPWTPGLGVPFLVAVLALGLATRWWRGLWWPAAALLGAGLSTLAAGPSVPCPEEASVTLEGEVSADSGPHALTLLASRLDGEPTRLRVSLRPASGAVPAGAQAGARVLVRARLRSFDARPANPGERSTAEHLERLGLRCAGRFDPRELAVVSTPSRWRAELDAERARLAVLARALAPTPDAAALFLALSAGERAAVAPALEEAFALSGLAHVLSVSGLHVAAFAACVFWLTRRLAVRSLPQLTRTLEPRRLAVPLAGAATWLYVVFTGAAPPAVRSALMVSAMLLGVLTAKRSATPGALALAACALAVVDPAACADLSVQLSFVSVLGLVLLGPALRALVPLPAVPVTVHGVRRAWWLGREAVLQGACASAAATLATAPLLALAFHRLGLAGVLSNAVCLPLCSALSVVAAFAALVSAGAPAFAVPLVALGTQLSSWLIAAARGFAQLPGAGLTVPSPGGLAMAAWWAGLLGFAVLRGRWRLTALLTLPALALTAGPAVLRERARLEVTFLSVGHGDAIVVSSLGHHALVDGGGIPHGADVGRRVVLPFLQQHGIDRLELAALTHPHPDHALGLASTLAAVPTARLWLPRGASDGPLVRAVVDAAKGAEVARVERGAAPLALGEATFRVLGPPVDRELLEGENDRSLVLSLTHGEVTFLLTGDLEAPGEEALATGPVTVLKAPHHGSRTSSTPALLAAARPRHVVFCVGRRNRFGFPHGEVVDRYRALGAACHRTDLDGAVTFESDGEDVRVTHFLPSAQSSAEGGLERR